MSGITQGEIAASAGSAAKRIGGLIAETPLEYSEQFSAATGAEVYFKLENLQHTGSFKLRGAANRLLTLTAEQRTAGCVVASSGNHGAAVTYAMRKLDIDGVVFVPEQTSTTKIEAIKSYGGEVRFFGTDGLDTERHAREHAGKNGMFYLSPYNDAEVIAGQGSCGVEIVAQLPEVDVAYIAVGGGGLIGGVGSVLKKRDPGMRVVGCQPEASAVMCRSVEAGGIVELSGRKTLSDGTAGGIEPDSITFDLCRGLVDDFILVDEGQIAAAMCRFIDWQHQLVEGAAGVAIAAMESDSEAIQGKKVLVLICGGNVSRETLKAIILSGAHD